MGSQLEIVVNPYGHAPLSARCRISPPLAVPTTLHVDGPAGSQRLRLPPGCDEVPLLCLTPSRLHRATLDTGAGEVSAEFLAGSLPSGLPRLRVLRCEPGAREPGFAVLALGRNPKAIQKVTDFECVLALDVRGEVAWLYESGISIMGVEPTARGTLLLMTTDGRIQEIDMLGRMLRQWFNPGEQPDGVAGGVPVHTAKFHHAVIELPDGWLAAVSIEFREVDAFPYAEQALDGVSTRQVVAGDTIVEFHPVTGQIRQELRLLDVLDPRRVGYHVMGPFWDNQGYPGCRDWSHQNSLQFDAANDAYLFTLRHQDACCRVGRDGTLHWILAPASGWGAQFQEKLLGGLYEWPFHPHDPTLLDNGDILLFDNGCVRAVPPQQPMPIEQCYSRAVRYTIDSTARQATEVWAWDGRSSELPYSAYLSGARELPKTRNVLVTAGGVLHKPDGQRTDVPPDGVGSVRLFEVTQEARPRVVFDLAIQCDADDSSRGWAAFRSTHLADLYGGRFSFPQRESGDKT
jgi:hypothetical protein